MPTNVLDAIAKSQSRTDLFDIFVEHFNSLGAKAVAYITPATAMGPFELIERGMPKDWISRYRSEDLKDVDPIPGTVYRLESPKGMHALLNALPTLSKDEKSFVEAFKTTSGITNGLAIPAFGPFGRPAFIGLAQFDPVESLDAIDRPYALAVSQVFHIRMESLMSDEPLPRLSPRERQITAWLIKGKSIPEIATILDLKEPTVATHVKRIYQRLKVHDRASCIAKAIAFRYM